jgi:hypothetical protein
LRLGYKGDGQSDWIITGCTIKDVLDFLEDAGILSDSHTEEFLSAPILVKNVVGVFSKLLHISADQHLSELDKVAMILIIHFDDTPWISPSAHLTAIRSSHNLVGADNSKGYFAGNFLVLGNSLFILVFIRGRLEDVDIVMCNIRKDLTEHYGSMVDDDVK